MVRNYNADLASATRVMRLEKDLVDGQWTTPANFDHFDSCAASQTNCIADGRESNEAPVFSVATSQNFTSNRYAGESAGREETVR